MGSHAPSITDCLLEDRITVQVSGDDRFDAPVRLDDDARLWQSRTASPDRLRFSLAHELGHLMLDVGESLDAEKAANRFAGAFLVPRSAVIRELGSRRDALDRQELHLLKHKYGLSMQAWVFRARDLGIVDAATATRYFRWFRQNGLHLQEPGDALPPETPQRLTRLVLRAVAEDVISHGRAAELLGMPWANFLERQAELHGEDLIAVGA